MYLEKLEINGFKSFANKNILKFSGMNNGKWGITAIVGPNGSGKSNIADGVRWVLGEQSMKMLRGKKSEDVIFVGSDKKNRLSMAEISLFLNNENKTLNNENKTQSINCEKYDSILNYSEIVLTRRLFRNGESEYLINNSRVRLSDIQILLAKANFGQKTYTVIGQGIVEGFLNTTLAERKEFFDEATGVKQFQIQRDESLNKLKLSYNNLNQANMLLAEITPRLKSLTKQINKLKQKDSIQIELKELQINYYRKIWHKINNSFNNFNNKFLELEKNKFAQEKKIQQLNNELDKTKQWKNVGQEFNKIQEQLNNLQNQKNNINKQLAKLEAQEEINLESRGKFDLSWLYNKKEELKQQIKHLKNEIKISEKNIQDNKNKLKNLDNQKQNLDKQINNLNNSLNKIAQNDNEKIQKINKRMQNLFSDLKQIKTQKDILKIKQIVHNVTKSFIQLFKEMKKIWLLPIDIEDDQVIELVSQENKIDQIRYKQLVEEKERIINSINQNYLQISTQTEKIKLFNKEINKTSQEIEAINNKLKYLDVSKDLDEKQDRQKTEKKELEIKLSNINKKINQIKEIINNLSDEEEKNRDCLLNLQKKIQIAQKEINQTNNQLNELKINATKQETKLEDLEIEIRCELGSLKEIKQKQVDEQIISCETTEIIRDKISQLKHRLNLIGSIDLETEKEYATTKERHNFLSEQTKDITQTIQSLEKIIKQLDLSIKEKFDKKFAVISKKFEEYFKILFNGGRAKIEKIMFDLSENADSQNINAQTDVQHISSENRLNLNPINNIKFLQKHNTAGLAGIQINATPPGKKIQSIAMLSGGEKALTAIALICAIISANPSPFVILDEVDAALDEVNSERFAQIINDLSHKTQFIIITHNRASMRKANILYGVTMGNDGISKLLSVKLESE